MEVLRALAFVLGTLVFSILVVVSSLFERDARPGWYFVRAWARYCLRISGSRLRVHGAEKLDPNQSYVFMSNHRSNGDIVAVAVALQNFDFRFVAKKELLRIPVFGWALAAAKNVVIDRSNHEQAVASFAVARERMQRGISVVVFPEATRGQGEGLLPFKKGGFVLAVETGRPIVPIAIRGSDVAMPRAGLRIRPATIDLLIGEPVVTEGVPLAEKERVMETVRERIAALYVRDLPPSEAA